MKVIIDGVHYVPVEGPTKEVMDLLSEVYGRLWTEAYYDGATDATAKFAQPLADLMIEANKILGFRT